jgi:uncharacterized protein YrrD
LRKARDLIGLPVLSIDTGKLEGHVKDLLIDDTWKLRGIVLEVRHWFSSLRYIEWENILGCGEDAITIPNESAIQIMEDDSHQLAFISGKLKLKGLPVITVGGHQLGMVEDVYLEPEMGKQILGYELSEGFISDLKDGRKWLPLPKMATRGEDAVIVPAHCIEEVEELFVSTEE